MGKLMRVHCQKNSEPSLRFIYNGQRINDNETPESHDMENYDIIEVYKPLTCSGFGNTGDKQKDDTQAMATLANEHNYSIPASSSADPETLTAPRSKIQECIDKCTRSNQMLARLQMELTPSTVTVSSVAAENINATGSNIAPQVNFSKSQAFGYNYIFEHKEHLQHQQPHHHQHQHQQKQQHQQQMQQQQQKHQHLQPQQQLHHEEDARDCPLCYNEYDSGNHRIRILYCGHSQCTSCMRMQFSNKKITCSSCRKTKTYKNVNSIPINYTAEKMKEQIDKMAKAANIVFSK